MGNCGIDDESDGMNMCFCNTVVFSDPVCAPVDIENEKGKAESILVRHLIPPGPVLLGPGDIAIIDEFRLVSLLEFALEDLLLGLKGEVLVIPAPVIEVVITEAYCLEQGGA